MPSGRQRHTTDRLHTERNRKLDCDRMKSWQVLRGVTFVTSLFPVRGVLRCIAVLPQCHHHQDSSTGLQALLRALPGHNSNHSSSTLATQEPLQMHPRRRRHP